MITDQTLEQLWQENLLEVKKRGRVSLKQLLNKLYSSHFPEILFNLFEKHIGIFESDGSKVITIKQLDSRSMQELIEENNACAIHVPEFCPVDIAQRLSTQALTEYTNWKLGGEIPTDMFYAGGSIPMEVARRSWSDFRRYFGERDEYIYRQRRMSGGSWPVDKLRLEIDEAWPFGAILGQWLGQKSRPAIMRIMDSNHASNPLAPEHGFIHTDDSPELKPSIGAFSANIYLKLPEHGGELYIWSVNMGRSKSMLDRFRAIIFKMIMTRGYTFDLEWQHKIQKFLPKPHIIKPNVGDLIIIHAGRPHSVEPVKDGIRITSQSSIYATGKKPLIITS